VSDEGVGRRAEAAAKVRAGRGPISLRRVGRGDVSKVWKRERALARALRAARPEGRDEFVAHLADGVAASRPVRRWSRVAFAGAMAVFMLGPFVSLGGLGYAASSAQDAANGITRIVKSAKHSGKFVVHTKKSSAEDQYGEMKITPIVKVKGGAVTKRPTTKVGGIGGPPAATSGGELPFTGLGLGATAGLGVLLLGLGALLRRREARSE
jgi:hypothetical protein